MSVTYLSDWKRLHNIKDPQHRDVELPHNFPHEIFQWVSGIKAATSTYASGWETETMIGPPRVYPQYGDIRGAWAPSASRGTFESLELLFSTPVFPTGVDIFETYNPGHIIRISFLRSSSPREIWEVAWEQLIVDIPPQQSRVYSPPLKEKLYMFQTQCIKIDLDCTYARSWCEIDCVVLRGLQFVEWAPEKHKDFPPLFKSMVKTVLLINERHVGTRLWLPKVMLYEIFNVCALSWPSEREIQQAQSKRQKEEEEWAKAVAKMKEKVEIRIRLLMELLKEGHITEEIFLQKKKDAYSRSRNTILEQVRKDKLFPEYELSVRLNDLDI